MAAFDPPGKGLNKSPWRQLDFPLALPHEGMLPIGKPGNITREATEMAPKSMRDVGIPVSVIASQAGGRRA